MQRPLIPSNGSRSYRISLMAAPLCSPVISERRAVKNSSSGELLPQAVQEQAGDENPSDLFIPPDPKIEGPGGPQTPELNT